MCFKVIISFLINFRNEKNSYNFFRSDCVFLTKYFLVQNAALRTIRGSLFVCMSVSFSFFAIYSKNLQATHTSKFVILCNVFFVCPLLSHLISFSAISLVLCTGCPCFSNLRISFFSAKLSTSNHFGSLSACPHVRLF